MFVLQIHRGPRRHGRAEGEEDKGRLITCVPLICFSCHLARFSLKRRNSYSYSKEGAKDGLKGSCNKLGLELRVVAASLVIHQSSRLSINVIIDAIVLLGSPSPFL